ncbi:hypothetical protein [Pelagerythrobacter sp.]|uniref:hypothetical protein n=1 Tax=Pelagerythrobacter sp. TaxID=2800702 RepID=UPI0035AF8E0E
MKGYLYVADVTGTEIEGSRRDLAHCQTPEAFQKIWTELAAKAGEDCVVLDSEIDRSQRGNEV